MYVQTKVLHLHPSMEKKASKYCGCLYYSANALARVMTKMADEEFAITGLSSSYAFLLMTVNDKPGIQPKEISQHMQLSPSTVTRLVEKMEYKGYLLRNQVGRGTEVHPTKLGQELHPKIKEAWKNLYAMYTSLIGESKANKLTNMINQAYDQLD